MSKKVISNNELEGLRQGPANAGKGKNQNLKANDMASVLMRLYPGFTLPETQSFLRDSQGLLATTKSGHTLQPDFILRNQKIIIEIDGQNNRICHYSKTKTCIDDLEKDETYKELGWTVIRIPAYIQLDKVMIKFLFGLDYDEDLYPACHLHGFLHEQISLPADFCKLGLVRFYKEMDSWPKVVKDKILDTLKERIVRFQEQGYDYQSAKLMVVPDDFKYDI